MQDPIVITGTNQEISEVISAELYDRLDGQLTLSFRTQIKNITSLTAGDEIALNGQNFRVTSVNRSIARGLYDLQAQSEHESMALTDQEVDEFAVSGRADGLLARIIEGSGFVAENRTGKNPYVTFEHTGRVTRRSLLNEMCRKLGAEIEYEGRVINLVNHRGSIERYEIAQRCPVMEFTANDSTDGVSYELVTDALYNVMVGDEVRITTDLPVEKQADVRVIGIRYNPFYTKRVVIEMGVPQKDIVDEIIDDRDRLKDYVEVDRFEDKVSSSVDTYIRSEEGKSSIEHVLHGTYLTRDEATGFVTETTLDASIKAYVDSPSGIAGIEAGLRGTFLTKNEMGDYVEKTELSTEIGQYIDTQAGTGKIISAMSGTYQKQSDMTGYAKTSDIPSLDGYVEKTELSTEIGQYIDTEAGTGKIVSAMSGTYQKTSDMGSYAKKTDIPSLDGYVTTTALNTSIGQYIDSTTGTAKIVSAASGTYQKKSDMGDYAKASAISTIEQSVSDVAAAITLSSSYSKNTIGTNVHALLQLVSNANSSSIKIKADKIDFTGFTTFLKASDLGSSGTTSIDGGRITTGTIAADRIDVDNLKFNTLYGKGTYSSYTAMTTSSTSLYVGGSSFSPSFTDVYIGATSKVYFGASNVFSICVDVKSDSIYSTFSGSMLGTSSYPWSEIYAGTSGSYHWKIDENAILPSSTSTYYFNIGSSSYPANKVYVRELYINGTKLETGSSSSSTSTDFSGKAVKMGGSSTYYIEATTNRELKPSSTSTYNPFSLGNSSYYWHNAYIGSVASYIGNSTSSKLGFFGTTPVTRQTVSSSATVSALITALKAYGLIG